MANLPDDLIAFVRNEIQGGGYGNTSDVVCDALRLMRERRKKPAALLGAIAEGDGDIRAGQTSPLTEERLRDIAERAGARGRKRQGKA